MNKKATLGISGVTPPSVPERDLVWDILLKNPVTDVALQQEIKVAMGHVEDMRLTMDGHFSAYEAKLEFSRIEMQRAREELASRREHLLSLRVRFLRELLLV
jgi:hypothetical protein